MSTRKTWYRVDTDDRTGEELVVRKRTVNQPDGFCATLEGARAAQTSANAKPPAQVIKPAGIESKESVHNTPPVKELFVPKNDTEQAAYDNLISKHPFAEFYRQGTTLLADQFAALRKQLPATIDTINVNLRAEGRKVNPTKIHKALQQFATLDVKSGMWR